MKAPLLSSENSYICCHVIYGINHAGLGNRRCHQMLSTMEKQIIEKSRDIRQQRHTRLAIRHVIRGAIVFIISISLVLAFEWARCRFRIPRHPFFPHGTQLAKDEFRLVEVHRAGVGKTRNRVYQVLDVPEDSGLHALSSIPSGKYVIPSMPRRTTHLADQTRQATENFITQSRLSKQAARDPFNPYLQSPVGEWITRDILAPNVSNKQALTAVAKVASNAYIRIPDSEDWYDIGEKWNQSHEFGWEENGLRGHVFTNSDNSTVIVAMKGTSPPFVGGGETSSNDKANVRITS